MQCILHRMSKYAFSTRLWGSRERLSDFPRSFTSDQVSQFYQDTLTTFATVCEWKNSFSPVNRVPLDILSLIPTHLASRGDRLRATLVCRHWRRTFLQRAELWSELFLSRESVRDGVKILLERAKGSALDIHISRGTPEDITVLLSPHTTQFRHLSLSYNSWKYILFFSEVNSGPLPLLRTLEISTTDEDNAEGSDTIAPLFRNAVNLKTFHFHSGSELQPSLGHFIFPNLTRLDFSAGALVSFHASQLLDFLETSPVLRTVHMRINGNIFFGGVPQERVVTLPNVENFDLTLGNGGPNYKIVAHISCPSARRTSLKHERATAGAIEEIFPSSDLWNTIVSRYTTSPLEEVTLETGLSANPVTCNVTLGFRDATSIELGFKDKYQAFFGPLLVEMHDHAFAHAIRMVQNHPQSTNIKRLHIHSGFYSSGEETMEVGQFPWYMGPLDELTLSYCDLWSYLHPFRDIGTATLTGSITFPLVKELAITHPVDLSDSQCAAVIGLAKSQHAVGTPLERVILRGEEPLIGIAGRLGQWVGSVECHLEEQCDEEWSDEEWVIRC